MLIKITRFSVQTLTLLSCFLPLLCVKAAHGVNPCEENIYLEVGTEGVVSCDFRDFALLGWINGNGNRGETPPFIYLENSQRKGVGYTDGDYDMEPDGSLIIKNVQFRNDVNYTALYVPSIGPQEFFEVPVRVFVRPDPEYPVINGLSKQQYIVQDVMSSGSIECTLNGTRPAVDLEWVYQSDIISIENEEYSKSSNYDGTHNTVLSSHFTIISGFVDRVTVKCRAAGELAHLFPLATTIYLQLERNYPIVNGLVNQALGVVEMNRRDELSCSMNRVPQDISLQWVLLTEEPSGELMLQNETSTVNNEDGTANITLTSLFSVLSPSIRRVTLQCRVSGQQADQYPDFTTVDVLISDRHPVVNGLTNRQPILLEIKREDELTCAMNGLSQDVSLEWVIITPDVADGVILEDRISNTSNGDGTFDILLTSNIRIVSDSLRRLTLQCQVTGVSAQLYPAVTTVELLLSSNFPVVNGHNSGQHVVLHLKREDELNCEISSVSEDISLEWVIITPGVTDEMALEEKHSKTSNEDGTFDVRLSRKFSILDNAIQHVTMECRVLDESSYQYQHVATVAVLITQNFPVVNGHNSGQHVVLHLKREDELNCEISSVSEDISLEWVIITPGVADEMALEDKHSKTSNEDGTFDVRLSRKFSILDNAIQHVTMECRMLDESTNQYQQVTTVAVLITQNTEDKDSNISGWTLSLVIVALLILIALTCLTLIIAKYGRKSHKRIALIYSIQQEKQRVEMQEGLPLHRRNMNGYVPHDDAPCNDDHELRCMTVSPPDNDDHEGTPLRGRNDDRQIQRDNSHQV